MAEQVGTWLYAVVPDGVAAPDADGVAGVGGGPVRLVRHARVAAVVGAVDLPGDRPLQKYLEDPAWLEPAARAHHRVVAAYFRAGPIVPFRLATVYRDDQRIREVLGENGPDLEAALGTVAGRAEWGVQAHPLAARSPLAARPGPAPPTVTGPPRPGTEYLLGRRDQQSSREAARQELAAAGLRIHRQLAEAAVAARRHTTTAGRSRRVVLNASYLVDRGRRADFVRTVERLDQQHPGLRLRVTGPWPAYSFVAIGPEPA